MKNKKCTKSLSGKHLWIECYRSHAWRMMEVKVVFCDYCKITNDKESDNKYD